MATQTYAGRHRTGHETGSAAAYNTEHWLAWLMVATSLALAAIGLLRGFGFIGEEATAVEGVTADNISGSILDGFLWMMPAIAAGLLSMALHQSGHHRTPVSDAGEHNESGLYGIEHMLAYILAAATIAAGAIALVVGFDVFDNGYTRGEGMLWGLAAIVGGALTVTLHTVGHHQPVDPVVTGTRTVEPANRPR